MDIQQIVLFNVFRLTPDYYICLIQPSPSPSFYSLYESERLQVFLTLHILMESETEIVIGSALDERTLDQLVIK